MTFQSVKLRIGQRSLTIAGEGTFSDGSKEKSLAGLDRFQITLGKQVLTGIVLKEDRAYVRFAMKKNIRIGRGADNDLIYLHPAVSKRHALIRFRKNQWEVVDTRSANGVYLNGKRVSRALFQTGDCLQICGIECWMGERFLYCLAPDKSRLKPYVFHAEHHGRVELKPCLDLPKKPKEKQRYPFRFTAFFFLGLMAFQNPLFLLLPLLLIVSMLFGFLKERREMRRYWPDCAKLARLVAGRGAAWRRHEAKISLGKKRSGMVLVHDFKAEPHLLLIGAKADQIALAAVYQLWVYDHDVSVRFEKRTPFNYFCQPRGKKSLYVGSQPNSCDFWIETTHRKGKDGGAWVDVDAGRCSRGKVRLDQSFAPRYFSAMFALENQTKMTDFASLTGLDEMDLFQIRKKFARQNKLTGVIGESGGEPLYLDLSGQHLLVAGMTGAGKSEWLLSYLLSLAIHYDSSDVRFFFIDFKGGGLSETFKNLHHTVMTLTDLDEGAMDKAVLALEDEIRVRERLFGAAMKKLKIANLSILEFKRYYALAHLIIVIDEFAELKLTYPQAMASLIRVARVGRSLGIHLILATQRPGGIVDSQILSNIRTRVCLKVNSPEDSFEMLGSKDAAFLKNPGAFILKDDQGTIAGQSHRAFAGKAAITISDEQDRVLNELAEKADLSLLDEINAQTQNTSPLYCRDFVWPPGPFNFLGLLDDAKHRQMKPAVFEKGALLVIGHEAGVKILKERFHAAVFTDLEHLPKADTLLVLDPHFGYDKAAWDQLFTYQRLILFFPHDGGIPSHVIQRCQILLFFDAQSAARVLGKRMLFQCDLKRQIGICAYEGEVYSCQIAPS